MKIEKKNYFKAALLILTILISSFVFINRFIAEQRNMDMEIVFDYEDVLRLRAHTGESLDNIYRSLQKAGVTTIALPEDTLTGLAEQGMATWMSGEKILNMLRTGQIQLRSLSAAKIVPGNYYVIIDRSNWYNRVKNSLVNELGQQRVSEVDRSVLEIKGYTDNLGQIGLGINEDIIESLRWYKFNVIPRLVNSTRLDDVSLGLKLDRIKELPEVNTIIFKGDDVLGYGNNMELVIDKMKKNQLNFGYIEFSKQRGERALAVSLPGQTIAVHSIEYARLKNMDMRKAIDRFFLAATERGIRILYVRPFLNDQLSKDLLAYNESYITELKTRLERRGFRITPVKKVELVPYTDFSLPFILIISMGVAVAFYLFLKLFFLALPDKFFGLLLTFFIISFFVFNATGHLYTWRSALALLTAIIFPSYGMICFMPKDDEWHNHDHSLRVILNIMLKIIGVTFLGALIITGLLSDPYHMLKIYQFTGVKISFIAPLLIVAFYYFMYPNKIKALRFIVKRFLQMQITIGHVAIVGGISFFLMFYLLRSGNYNLPLFNFEYGLRKILGVVMLVRPRTKEFLIGYPLIIFTLTYLGSAIKYQHKWLFYTIATVAPISMLNTFCHFHAPLWLSLVRSLNGLFLGVVIGLLAVVLYRLIEKIWRAVFL